ncbi:FAD-dependent monooxygenase [Amycolatopsis silviterrae]|uniref:FAD-dependent monooxygenase n=1 Tax=Amycolatopsis silviterrae TaxID=1656914 RepID=A0ABW5H2E9_9PSEU
MTARSVACVGAGPAGLLAATQIKLARPGWQVLVYERAPKDVTYGYGVVFSDVAVRTIEYLAPELGALLANQTRWDDVEIRAGGARYRIPGHGYAALSRHRLLGALAGRAAAVGVDLRYETPATLDDLRGEHDLVVAADGAHSQIRGQLAEELGATVRYGRSKFAWLGTTASFDAMTFVFERTEHGVVVAHGYPHEDGLSTFVVEVPGDGPERGLTQWAEVFADHLGGQALRANGLRWERFPVVQLRNCVHRNVVVIGDAAHTVHYSVGSGTRMALEDGFYLARSLARHDELAPALAEYQRRRLPSTGELQSAGERSMRWFEDAPSHLNKPPAQFAVHLLTRANSVPLATLTAEASQLAEDATEALAGPLSDRDLLDLPLTVGPVRLAGRLAVEAPGSLMVPIAVVDPTRLADDPAWSADFAGAKVISVDLGPYREDPAEERANARRMTAALRDLDRPEDTVLAIRSTLASTADLPPPALLARLRELCAAGWCDLVDLAADDGPPALAAALETADLVRRETGRPVMLSRFRAAHDIVRTHLLAGRIDLWCAESGARP